MIFSRLFPLVATALAIAGCCTNDLEVRERSLAAVSARSVGTADLASYGRFIGTEAGALKSLALDAAKAADEDGGRCEIGNRTVAAQAGSLLVYSDPPPVEFDAASFTQDQALAVAELCAAGGAGDPRRCAYAELLAASVGGQAAAMAYTLAAAEAAQALRSGGLDPAQQAALWSGLQVPVADFADSVDDWPASFLPEASIEAADADARSELSAAVLPALACYARNAQLASLGPGTDPRGAADVQAARDAYVVAARGALAKASNRLGYVPRPGACASPADASGACVQARIDALQRACDELEAAATAADEIGVRLEG